MEKFENKEVKGKVEKYHKVEGKPAGIAIAGTWYNATERTEQYITKALEGKQVMLKVDGKNLIHFVSVVGGSEEQKPAPTGASLSSGIEKGLNGTPNYSLRQTAMNCATNIFVVYAEHSGKDLPLMDEVPGAISLIAAKLEKWLAR
jgi:hypothetical protein